jgi:Stage II sporulation protein E (SpoIIE)
VLYTDGVTEAENDAGQSLDREHLLQWALEAPTDSPQALGRTLLQRLDAFQDRCRNDDETLVVLQREKVSFVSLKSPGATSCVCSTGKMGQVLERNSTQPESTHHFHVRCDSMMLDAQSLRETLEVELKNANSPEGP